MDYIKKLLVSKYFQPVLSILALLESAVIAVIGWVIVQKPQENTSAQVETNNTLILFLLALIIITLIITIIGIVINTKNKTKKSIITSLCELQNTYLTSPNFVTAQDHTDVSEEKNLSKGGNAKILTNSLTYDMACSNDIAENVKSGAKYTYILPNNNIVIEELEQYIVNISNNLGDLVQATNLMAENIEFWFFDKNIACLYNFATLRQTAINGTRAFDQAWWYINPCSHSPSSYMLTKEITNTNDREILSEVFIQLEKCSSKYTGKEIFEKRTELRSLIRG